MGDEDVLGDVNFEILSKVSRGLEQLPNYIHLMEFLHTPTQPLNKRPKPVLQPQLFESREGVIFRC